jgi:hypothetical protein
MSEIDKNKRIDHQSPAGFAEAHHAPGPNVSH